MQIFQYMVTYLGHQYLNIRIFINFVLLTHEVSQRIYKRKATSGLICRQRAALSLKKKIFRRILLSCRQELGARYEACRTKKITFLITFSTTQLKGFIYCIIDTNWVVPLCKLVPFYTRSDTARVTPFNTGRAQGNLKYD